MYVASISQPWGRNREDHDAVTSPAPSVGAIGGLEVTAHLLAGGGYPDEVRDTTSASHPHAIAFVPSTKQMHPKRKVLKS